MPMEVCRRRLALLWFPLSGLIFLLMFGQTIFGHYPDNSAVAWGWLLPSIMPTLSLIVTVLVRETETGRKTKANPFLFRLAFGLSFFYLFLLLATLLLEPVMRVPLEAVFSLSDIWLGPIQGLVAAALGAFFVAK